MTPFQEFRLWLRRAPIGERLSAALVGLLAASLLIWVAIPTDNTADEAALGFGPSPTGPGATPGPLGETPGAVPGGEPGSGPGVTGPGVTGPGGSVPTTGPGSVPTTGPGGQPAPTSGPNAKSCPSSSANGVSASQMKLAVIIVDIAGAAANSFFGVLPAEQQREFYTRFVNDLNKRGGVACRQVTVQFFTGNPADRNSLQATCLDVVQAKPFAVLDNGAYAAFAEVGCFGQRRLPYFGGYLLQEAIQRQFYPYLFNLNTQEQLYRDGVFALQSKGYLKNTASFKLGFVYRTCNPTLARSVVGWLNQAGVPSSKIVTYDVGCPSTFATPTALSAAIRRFERNDVNHLIWADFVGDAANFTRLAQQQRFRPQYLLADESLIATSYGNNHINYQNMNNAIVITASRSGEERTPGVKMSTGTKRCNKVLKVDVRDLPAAAGNICDQGWMFEAAANNAPALQQNALAAGLQAAKSVDFSYPQGPNDFTRNGVTYGGQAWRVAKFTTNCNCWRLLSEKFTGTFS